MWAVFATLYTNGIYIKGAGVCFRKQRFTVHDVLNALEEDPDFFEADVFITPPGNGAASDEDSADEDESTSPDNFSGRQLIAEADATVHRSYSRRERLMDEEHLSDTDVNEPDNISEDIQPVSTTQ